MFLWGEACGAAIVLFALLARWLRRKEVDEPYLSWRRNIVYGKGLVFCACYTLMAVVVAIAGTLDATLGLPHPEWATGVLFGAGAALGLRWLWGHLDADGTGP